CCAALRPALHRRRPDRRRRGLHGARGQRLRRLSRSPRRLRRRRGTAAGGGGARTLPDGGCAVITERAAAALARSGTTHVLGLLIADVPIVVQMNDLSVWTALRLYYDPWVVRETPADAAVVRLVHDGSVTPPDGFHDVVRADGRKVKESAREGDGERLILKRTTGVLMGVRPGRAWATGDIAGNLNQAIHLVN